MSNPTENSISNNVKAQIQSFCSEHGICVNEAKLSDRNVVLLTKHAKSRPDTMMIVRMDPIMNSDTNIVPEDSFPSSESGCVSAATVESKTDLEAKKVPALPNY